MKKNVLIINSNFREVASFFDILKNFEGNYKYFALTSSFRNDIKKIYNNKNIKLYYYLGWLSFDNWIASLFFLAFYSFLIIIYFFYSIIIALVIGVKTVVCVSLIDKVLFSIPFRVIGKKVIWFELPNEKEYQFNLVIKVLCKVNAKFSNNIIVLSDYAKEKLKIIGIKKEKIIKVYPALNTLNDIHQDSLFNNMAAKEREGNTRRYFTLGLITDLNKENNLKVFLEAVKQCLDVIPNLQVIIIGDGKEKNNLDWMTKTMAIDNIVWFVGRQVRLYRWIRNFDCFVSVHFLPSLSDLNILLRVIHAKVPVIAQRHVGLEELTVSLDNRLNTLIDIDNVSMLTKKIIEIEQKAVARQKIAELQKEKVVREFTLERQFNKFKEIL